MLIPHKHCQLVIGIQTSQGVKASGTLWSIPLPEGFELTNQQNYSFFQYAGGHYDLKWYETGGQWVEGTIRMPAIPGYLGGASTDLSNWMWGRSGDYNQGYYATIYRDMGNSLVECYLDCVCTGGTIAVDFGAEYAALDLNVTGIAAPTSATITNEDETMFQIRPYRFSEASITLEAACNVTRNHTLTWDNMVESPADMGVLNGSTYPYALPNNALAQWTGSFDKLFTDSSTVYSRFLAGTESKYTLTLTRSAVATCVISMPRIIYTENPLSAPGDGIVREEGINFQALGSTDGSTYACTITET